MDIDHLSYSSLSAYTQCQRRFYYEQVLGLTGPPSASLAVGQIVHKGLRDVLDGTVSVQDALGLERHTLESLDSIPNNDEDFEKLFSRAQERFTLLVEYLKTTFWPPAARPVMAESTLTREVGGVKLVGIVDLLTLVNGKATIVDYKTTQRVPSRVKPSHVDQAIMYALLAGLPGSDVHIVYFGLGTRAKIEAYTVHVTQALIDQYVADVVLPTITQLRKAKDISDFITNSKSPLCSAKWCPFYDVCRGLQTIEQLAHTGKLRARSAKGERVLWEML